MISILYYNVKLSVEYRYDSTAVTDGLSMN